MPLYNFKQLKERSGHKKVNELEMKVDVTKKIWIPDDACYYQRVHFNIKAATPFKHSHKDVLDCFNKDLGEDGKGCPICDLKSKMWEEWRKASKEEKKKLQDRINKLVAELFYWNCVDLEDPEFKFQAVRFSKAKNLEIQNGIELHGIGNIIWYFTKKEKSGITSYTLTAIDDRPEIIKKMKEKLDALKSRAPENGGYIDLVSAFSRPQRKLEEYVNILNGDGENADETSEPKENKETKKTSIEEDSLTLDDIESENKSKKTDVDSELSLDYLDKPSGTDKSDLDNLDDLNLEDIEDVKIINIDVEMVKNKIEKEKDKVWVDMIHVYLHDKGDVKMFPNYREKALAVYAFIKKVKSIQVDEKLLKSQGIPY